MKVMSVDCNINQQWLSSTVERVTLEQFLSIQALLDTEILIWNNKTNFELGYLDTLPKLRCLINWGTDTSNLPANLTDYVAVWDTQGYCTAAVIEWTLALLVKQSFFYDRNEPLGFIGLGRIGYSLAKRLYEPGRAIFYNARSEKPGLAGLCQYVSASTVQSRCKLIIIAIQGNQSVADINALSDNSRRPVIINLSREAVFPLTSVQPLIGNNHFETVISDNEVPKNTPSALIKLLHGPCRL